MSAPRVWRGPGPLLCCVTWLFLAACEWAFPLVREDPSTDGGTDGSGPAFDAEAGADTDAGTAMDAMPDVENLLQNGDFELGCASTWKGYLATLADDTTVRSGTLSCRVCKKADPSPQFYIEPVYNGLSVVTAVSPFSRYRVEAWVRAIDGTPAPSTAFVALQAWNDSFSGTERNAAPETLLDGSAWTLLTTDFIPISDASTRLGAQIGSTTAPDGTCMLVDDVRIYVVK